jgi:predicted ArsR family transcriptional regulator
MQLTTRSLILEYLRHHPGSPPRQVASALHLVITDVRYHLQHLVEEGQVENIARDNSGCRGRPAVLYRLTPGCNPTALALLTGGLLTIIETDIDDPDDHRLATSLLPADLPGISSPVLRITHLIQYLNTLGYDAHWEARPDYPVVEFRQCPFSSLVAGHPFLCQIDQAILGVAAGFHVTQQLRLPCTFLIDRNHAIETG